MILLVLTMAEVSAGLFGAQFTYAIPTKTVATVGIQDLTVEEAVSIALARSLIYKAAKLNFDQSKISYDAAWDTMYMPNISLNYGTEALATVVHLPGTPAASDPYSGINRGYPTSTVGITLANYNIFNFFRDQLVYTNAKLTYERAQQILTETQRSMRNNVVKAYFQAKTDQAKLEATRRSVEISQAILDLINSRKALGQATPEEVSSSRVDLLNAKTAFEQADQTSYESMASFNILIDTSIAQKFNLVSNVKFTPLKTTADEAFQIFRSSAPSMRGAVLSLRTSENNVELAEKNRLPLPTISFTGLSIGYTQAYAGGSSAINNNAATSSPGGQIDVQAAVTATIPILGPGGFLGQRAVSSARIAKDSAEIGVIQTSTAGDFQIQRSVVAIHREEVQIQVLKEVFEKDVKLLEDVFKKMSTTKINRLEFRDAINEARNAENAYLDALNQHLSDKLTFSELIGVDRLPNDELY